MYVDLWEQPVLTQYQFHVMSQIQAVFRETPGPGLIKSSNHTLERHIWFCSESLQILQRSNGLQTPPAPPVYPHRGNTPPCSCGSLQDGLYNRKKPDSCPEVLQDDGWFWSTDGPPEQSPLLLRTLTRTAKSRVLNSMYWAELTCYFCSGGTQCFYSVVQVCGAEPGTSSLCRPCSVLMQSEPFWSAHNHHEHVDNSKPFILHTDKNKPSSKRLMSRRSTAASCGHRVSLSSI